MNNYDIIFEKLIELTAEEDPASKREAGNDELEEIEQLRRFAADLKEPEPVSFTTT